MNAIAPQTFEERFWSRVQKSNDCWVWTGVKVRGYGEISQKVDGKWRNRRAHRVAIELSTGVPIPDGMIVLHSCDNPSCVNPKHLRVGTQTDNMRDMAGKGRDAQTPKTQCAKGHDLNGDNLIFGSRGERRCRTCALEATRDWRRRKRLGLPLFRRPKQTNEQREAVLQKAAEALIGWMEVFPCPQSAPSKASWDEYSPAEQMAARLALQSVLDVISEESAA